MKILMLLFTFNLMALANINGQVYVNINAVGSNTGMSWQDAYVNLDTAISRTDSGQIWVAEGIYIPSVEIFATRIYKAFVISKRISLYGGFDGTETSLSQRGVLGNETILSGDIGIPGVDGDNAPKVIIFSGTNTDSSTILDGFTISKSHYTIQDDYESGAIFIDCVGSPVIRNCTITDNSGHDGGGICVRNSDPLIIHNTISNNFALEGAGIFLSYATYARIIENKLINNQCIGSYSHLAGGGIKINEYCSPVIYGNLIDSNSAGNYGGGIANESNYGVVISNNIISHNTSQYGGGIYINYSPTEIVNNLIVENYSETGAGLYIDYTPNSNSINNTIARNFASYSGNAAYLTSANMNIVNTIFDSTNYSHVPTICIIIGRTDWFPKFQYCNVRNGLSGIAINYSNFLDSIWGIGNILSNPDFRNILNHNYQLDIQSTCINGGNPDTTGLNLPSVDLLDSSRMIYGCIDIGCYEFDSASYHTQGLEIINENQANVYPNPFIDELKIKFNSLEAVEIVLFDAISKELFKQKFVGYTSINTEQFSKGIYIYELRNRSRVLQKGKIVKN